MGFHKLKPSETVLLRMSEKVVDGDSERKPLVEGQDIHLSLKLGYFYFVHPVQWAIKFKNGSSSHICKQNITTFLWWKCDFLMKKNTIREKVSHRV